jgi:hypothetical protein
VNREFICELVRAHYTGDEERFDILVEQIARSEEIRGLPGSAEVAARLRDIQRNRG